MLWLKINWNLNVLMNNGEWIIDNGQWIMDN